MINPPWSLEIPGLYQYLELSCTNLALTLMSGSSEQLCCEADPLVLSPTVGEKVTWCIGEGADETRSRALCPFRDAAVEENRFFSGSGGWMEGMVTAVYPVYGTWGTFSKE